MDQTRRARWFSAVLLGAVVLGLVGRGATPARAADTDPDTFRALDIGDGLVTLDVQDAPFLQVVTERIQPRTRVWTWAERVSSTATTPTVRIARVKSRSPTTSLVSPIAVACAGSSSTGA